MSEKDRFRKSERAIGPRIVRAWFDTVINPMLKSLRAEHDMLERRDWTWQFHRDQLEMIENAAEYVDANAVDNLEQLLAFFPELKGKIDDHDVDRNQLLDACRALQAAIVTNSNLENIYKRVTAPESLSDLGREIRTLFISEEPLEHINLLTEYIVNNTRELPYYYTVSALWNRYREEFLKILDHPSVVSQSRKAIEVGEQLVKSNEALVKRLKEVREGLSLEHDVPYVGALELSLRDTI
ncbi:MAG: hypothetical protein L0387_23960 [Acidobacteria bacterium]|nr:hypothetical protein [Acidobacteriota bacterium]MCI0722578.1 hypothetical protein [Acidobacteriota bacterium]